MCKFQIDNNIESFSKFYCLLVTERAGLRRAQILFSKEARSESLFSFEVCQFFSENFYNGFCTRRGIGHQKEARKNHGTGVRRFAGNGSPQKFV